MRRSWRHVAIALACGLTASCTIGSDQADEPTPSDPAPQAPADGEAPPDGDAPAEGDTPDAAPPAPTSCAPRGIPVADRDALSRTPSLAACPEAFMDLLIEGTLRRDDNGRLT